MCLLKRKKSIFCASLKPKLSAMDKIKFCLFIEDGKETNTFNNFDYFAKKKSKYVAHLSELIFAYIERIVENKLQKN